MEVEKGMSDKGLYQKYIITKTSGKELDPDFYAIVLRVDGGRYVGACRVGVEAFADAVEEENPLFAKDLRLMLLGYELKEHDSRNDPSAYRYG